MSNGKGHDRFNLLFGAVACGVILGVTQDLILALIFGAGVVIATLFFSPDTDIMPKKRAHIFRFFLFPYSIIFKHRGISHSFWVGTLTRVLYGIIFTGIIIFVMNKMGVVSFDSANYFTGILHFFLDFNYQLLPYKILTWFFAGLFFADSCHLFLDRFF
jgi:uncharacterized metal-binding protein